MCPYQLLGREAGTAVTLHRLLEFEPYKSRSSNDDGSAGELCALWLSAQRYALTGMEATHTRWRWHLSVAVQSQQRQTVRCRWYVLLRSAASTVWPLALTEILQHCWWMRHPCWMFNLPRHFFRYY